MEAVHGLLLSQSSFIVINIATESQRLYLQLKLIIVFLRF
jgi:hypothetical protein